MSVIAVTALAVPTASCVSSLPGHCELDRPDVLSCRHYTLSKLMNTTGGYRHAVESRQSTKQV